MVRLFGKYFEKRNTLTISTKEQKKTEGEVVLGCYSSAGFTGAGNYCIGIVNTEQPLLSES